MQSDLLRSDPEIMVGNPVIACTHITVELVLEKLLLVRSSNRSSRNTRVSPMKKIRAALAFASATLWADVVYPITRRKSEIPC
jgi:uncharacterized protein (DUF433 family)